MPYVTNWERRAMKRGMEEGLLEGRQKGWQEGRIKDKQEILIRQLSRKFTLAKEEQVSIENCTDPGKLDAALDEMIFAGNKEAVLRFL